MITNVEGKIYLTSIIDVKLKYLEYKSISTKQYYLVDDLEINLNTLKFK